MAATYNASLPTDKDWVRFLIGDKDTTNALLQDEEIAATLLEEPNKYLAAALCATTIMAMGNDATKKMVGDLSLEFSDSADSAYKRVIDDLKEKGCRLLLQQTGAHSLRNL